LRVHSEDKIQTLSESAQNFADLCLWWQPILIYPPFQLLMKLLKEQLRELWDAIQAGLILLVGDDYKFLKQTEEVNDLSIHYTIYSRSHPTKAAYSLIPQTTKRSGSWKIGQLLLPKYTPPQILQQKIFVCQSTQLRYSSN
jgi:predicted ATPase